MKSLNAVRWGTGLAAAVLVGWGATLPLWSMKMEAPQYPKGLRLDAYGTGMAGDVSELNILNHYIGMPPLEAPAFETAVFPYGIGLLVVLCLLSPLHRWLRRLAVTALVVAPLSILADLQYRLYEFGHTLNPTAPIRLKPFTPLVIGETEMGNFESHAMVAIGFWFLIAAAVLVALPGFLERRQRKVAPPPALRKPAAVAAAVLALCVVTQPGLVAGDKAVPATAPLQALIDAAPRGGTVVVPAGQYAGPVVIRGPLTVIADGLVTIEGTGEGSVVTLDGSDVEFRGFTVRNSGRNVTEEAAGIKASGDRHLITGNTVRDVYFGIHVGGGADVVVRDNIIVPGTGHGARPGHGVSAWNLRNSEISANRVSEARDGIYLSFTEGIRVSGNVVTGCRYGLHSMYSQDAHFIGNRVTGNLLGAALMNSDRLEFRGNRIAQHREGAAAYGILLKDIGVLQAEDNEILSNRVGVYAEGVPWSESALFINNVIAGNEVGLALQSTAALTFTGNRIAENLTDVRALGRQLSAGMRWSRDGRGNAWGQYRGFDANRDGIGDVPYRLEDAMDALVRRNSSIQAFLYTPAHLAVEAAARMFPLYRQAPVLVDEFPLMSLAR